MLYKQQQSPSQSKKPIYSNDLELAKTIEKLIPIHKLNQGTQNYLRVFLTRMERTKNGIDLSGCRWDMQQTWADRMGCSRGVVVRAEKALVKAGILNHLLVRSQDRMRLKRELKIGHAFFLALAATKTKKKPNDLPLYCFDTGPSTETIQELIPTLVNIDYKIGNTPKEPIKLHNEIGPKNETDAVSNSNKTNFNSLLKGLCKPTTKTNSRTCDLTDEFFPKSGEGYIPWDTINPAIERLIVLRGHAGVREDLGKIFKGKAIVERLEISGKVFGYLEDS